MSTQTRRSVEVRVDVTDTARIGQQAATAATVFLPKPGELSEPPVVCFAFAGGGYSRRYYSLDMPGEIGGQAGFHVERGWIFVAADHLGFGESTVPAIDNLTYDNIALGNRGTVESVMARLENGTLLDGYPPVAPRAMLGLGHSMGGCLLIVQQGQHGTFDGVASLGFSGIHTHVEFRPGRPRAVWPWILRGADISSATPLNAAALQAAARTQTEAPVGAEHPWEWAFHFDDVPADMVAADMAVTAGIATGPLPPWRSSTQPACGLSMVTPGTVATEAAAITVPVLLAMGERDVVPNPWMEPFAFRSSTDITLYICPRMAHIHNFASTRHRFWDRIHSWGEGVARQRHSRIP